MQITHRGTIYQNSDSNSHTCCAYFPSLARLGDGRILCSFQVASDKSGPDETIRICESRDEGKTWHLTSFEPSTRFNDVHGGFRLAYIVETKPNELFMVANWLDRSDPVAPISHPETAGVLPMKLLCFCSHDGGMLWSEAVEIKSPVEQTEISGPIIALKEPGHFLVPCENQKHYLDPNPIHEKAFALISRDYCQTWNECVPIVDRFPLFKHWGNRMARLPESGKLVCFSWTFDENTQQDLPIHILYGSPDGTEWSEPVSTGVLGQLCTPLPLDESILLMGYVHRHQPASIRLGKSLDGGETWDAAEELVVYEGAKDAHSDGHGGDITEYYKFMAAYTFGWNPMVRLQNGNALMAFFAGTERQMNIYWVEIAP